MQQKDSVASILARLKNGIVVHFSVAQEIYFFSKVCRPILDKLSVIGLLARTKWNICKSDYSSPSLVKIKNDCN